MALKWHNAAIKMAKEGRTAEQIMDGVGISADVYHRHCQRNPDLAAQLPRVVKIDEPPTLTAEISLIAAIDRNGGLGKNGDLQWHQSADLQRFRFLTHGHTVIMGRKTYQSLNSVALPDRKLVILTNRKDFTVDHPDVQVASSLVMALLDAQQAGAEKIFLAGGEEVYTLGLGFADKIYVTEIDTAINRPDVVFPVWDLPHWHLIETRGPYRADDSNQYPYTYKTYTRRQK